MQGLSGGSGSALITDPAQNAIRQLDQDRPATASVRIMLDPDELEKHLLRVGLSMNATVNVASSR